MKKFIIKTFRFFSPLIILFLLGSVAIDHGLRKSGYGEFAEWNDIFSGNINADVIINGSSRAWVHVSPKIIDSVLKLNSYNIGMDGWNFHMQVTRYNIYKKYNSQPKIIIHCLDMTTLERRKNLYAYQQFLPYLNNPMIAKTTKKYTGLTFFDYHFPFYKYVGQNEIIKIGLLEFFNITHYNNNKFKGYLGENSDWNQEEFDKFKKEYPDGIKIILDKESVELFDNYLKESKENEIKVFLIYPPEYIEAHNYIHDREYIIYLYRGIAKKHGIVFLDYSNDSISYNKLFFYNSQHLNKKGSEVFSNKLANDLKKLIFSQ